MTSGLVPAYWAASKSEIPAASQSEIAVRRIAYGARYGRPAAITAGFQWFRRHAWRSIGAPPRPGKTSSLERSGVGIDRSAAPATALRGHPTDAPVRSCRRDEWRACLAGEGVRWDTVDLRRSTNFKCTGAASEPLKTALTDENTVGLDADFYRAGDGNDESFTAQMIVSADDLAADIPGIQNVWIQGVGCASAIANFSS